MKLRELKGRIKALEDSNEVDPEYLQVLAVENVLDTLTPEEAADFEAAMMKMLALADAGYSESEIKCMLPPATLAILDDLKRRSDALLSKIRE